MRKGSPVPSVLPISPCRRITPPLGALASNGTDGASGYQRRAASGPGPRARHHARAAAVRRAKNRPARCGPRARRYRCRAGGRRRSSPPAARSRATASLARDPLPAGLQPGRRARPGRGRRARVAKISRLRRLAHGNQFSRVPMERYTDPMTHPSCGLARRDRPLRCHRPTEHPARRPLGAGGACVLRGTGESSLGVAARP